MHIFYRAYYLCRVNDTDYYRINDLTLHGQGTIGLELQATKDSICIKLNQSTSDDFISLDIGTNRACILMRKDNKEVKLDKTTDRKAFLNTEMKQLYWFSLDRKNYFLRYGIGPMQSLLTVLSVDFKKYIKDLLQKDLPQNDLSQNDLSQQDQKIKDQVEEYGKWIKKFDNVTVRGLVTRQENPSVYQVNFSKLTFWPLPVTVDLPPNIIKCEDATLEGLELGKVTVIDNLPEECQKLYWNIASDNISLNTHDFPDFALAIEHSIRNNEGICYKKLEEKAKGKNPEETYLRVTLGQDQGNSPGAPFVLEIWPSGHYSPVHKHADYFAVIKGEITWISNKFYQIHQLKNKTDKMCATLQYYQYGNKDEDHYENFKYFDSKDDKIKNFKPESDWTFAEFKKLIMKEWKQSFRKDSSV
ncbi:hypothetical protein RhiirA4_476350 [Rhizophagus irregularis]|uniref:Cysteine dioxygenase n=1 Tax=Rhizophagus irregularis TaxID=588596 RepID=A0A2I1HBL0_9GLOM|nr:hypothetical protein RhiirA4_476350 [Rhizophagus irregularis]